ncbi:MAG: Fe-S cluster assembly protein SufD [Chloroflexi bacterium]|nr:Fe-S cluster assembly protein SufD [Chloroflexota bacterium]MDL1882507.1 Fe-S cluster assembly protein SufD [Anaerolineae bacterium CFX8]
MIPEEKLTVAVVKQRRRSLAPAVPNYTEADVRALSAANNEPVWLLESRLAAWELYEDMPMPTLNDEDWRRTDYRHIRWDEADRIITPNGATLDIVPPYNREPLIGDRQGGLLVVVDGKIVQHEVADELAGQGIIFTDLRTACRDYADLVRPNLMTKAVLPGEGKFAALHAALWTHGVFLYVPRNKAAELPFHVVFYNTHPGASLGHVLVVLEENAQATMLVDYASSPAEQHSAYIGATELLVGDAANLQYVGLQDWNRETYEFSHQRARVGRNANLDWIVGTMGGRLVKTYMELELDGLGAHGRMSGFFFADNEQLFDHDTQQNHNAPITVSDLLFKGAAKDHARTVWQGMIKSLPNMQKIDGFQASRNLVLSEHARMDGIPGLEIEADDVACSHAATFGTLEKEPVFYLMSRGIPRPTAELMVIDGFFDELLQRIPFERVRERLQAAMEAKIIGA